MIKLELIGNEYKFEIENIIQLFFPDQKVSPIEGEFARIIVFKYNLNLSVSVRMGSKFFERQGIATTDHDAERHLCQLLFEILTEATGIYPKWGIQTGVRPTKLLRNLTNKYGFEYAEDYFKNKLLTSDEKFELAKKIEKIQSNILNKQDEKSFSLYISIPFCKSRCSYCSFISHDITKSAKLIPEYVDYLCKEIKYTAKVSKDLGLKLQTIYIGGGTPTVLSPEEITRISKTVYDNFDTSNVIEYTIEAGRPDTITKEKLLAIKNAGANRISVNPQTLNDEVLRIIKRNHTVDEFYNAYNDALSVGFKNINTDLIAGLPGDDYASFCKTIDGIVELEPSCITVHTLSIKRSSTLVYKGDANYNPSGEIVSDMLDYSSNILKTNNYLPYYMYRQSRMAGNNENIGWSKPGFESFYNVFIMEETQTILAVGAGASTKLVGQDKIERIFNYKFPYEYKKEFKEMIRRKQKIYEFYK